MVKSVLKQFAYRLGLDVQRYSVQTSDRARLQKLLEFHQIDQILDVGANIGNYGIYLRRIGYKSTILSFEPLGSAYITLVKRSQRDDRWQVAPQMAIGDHDGEITINVAGNSESSSVLPMLNNHLQAAPQSAYISQETVSIHQLDTILPSLISLDSAQTFMKLDVQGFESQVLKGATEVLPRIKGIQIELSLIPLYQSQLLFREMVDHLESFGYQLQGIIPGFTDPKTGQTLQLDGIFFRT